MTRAVGGVAAALVVVLPAPAFGATEPALGSRLLETVSVPAKRVNGEYTKTFTTKLKKGRVYSVRWSGSYRLGDASYDAGYCYAGGGGCSEPNSFYGVAQVGIFKRVKGDEPAYAGFRTLHDTTDPYPPFQSDHVYTMRYPSTFSTQLRASACPFTSCGDVGALDVRLFQSPFPAGYLKLWGVDCRDGERYDTPIVFSSGQCQRVLLEADSGRLAGPPSEGLRLQKRRTKRRHGEKRWKNIGSSTIVYGAMPTTLLNVQNGTGVGKYRAIIAKGDGDDQQILKKSNVITIDWIA